MKPALLTARLAFGAWMVLNGLNHVFGPFWPAPTGTEPLAVQLMSALRHIGLLDLAMGVQLVCGVLILAGVFVPAALCATMPISVCAAYWAVILEHEPVGALLALVAVALNGLLMLAHLDSYRGVLERHALAIGEAEEAGMTYRALFANPAGRTARAPYVAALLTLLAAFAFYWLWVPGRTGAFAMLVMIYPGLVLHARRLHDMGWPGWPVLVPGALLAAAGWFHLYDPEAAAMRPLALVALAVSVGFILLGLAGQGRAERAASA